MSTKQANSEKRIGRLSIAKCLVVGTDAEGAQHRFDWTDDVVYVLQDGQVAHVEEIEHGDLPRWVAYVAEERGWNDLRYRDTDPFQEAGLDV